MFLFHYMFACKELCVSLSFIKDEHQTSRYDDETVLIEVSIFTMMSNLFVNVSMIGDLPNLIKIWNIFLVYFE